MTLERIKNMPDVEIQSWLRKVGTQGVPNLVNALLGADSSVRERILKNMSPRAGGALKEEVQRAARQNVSAAAIQSSAATLEALF